uniref:Uncharacterized protein n=1 Tax=Caenorhabditis japonica TaxID=281687 RepID=A0A8R1DEW1_CAEJA
MQLEQLDFFRVTLFLRKHLKTQQDLLHLGNFAACDAKGLWDKFLHKMSEDFEHQKMSTEQAESMTYFDIYERMDVMKEDLRKWLDLHFDRVHINDYDQCEKNGLDMQNQITDEQELIIQKTLNALNSNSEGLFFINSPGGSAIGDGLRGDEVTGEILVPNEMKINGNFAVEVIQDLLNNQEDIELEQLSKVAILSPRRKEALQLNESILRTKNKPVFGHKSS